MEKEYLILLFATEFNIIPAIYISFDQMAVFLLQFSTKNLAYPRRATWTPYLVFLHLIISKIREENFK